MIADRLLVALAAMRLTNREVTDLKRFLTERSTSEVVDILHQVEDQIDSGAVQYRPSIESTNLAVESELEQRFRQLYHNDLKTTAAVFIDAISEISKSEGRHLASFDPKKGMRYWIRQALKQTSASELLRFASLVKTMAEQDTRTWRLR